MVIQAVCVSATKGTKITAVILPTVANQIKKRAKSPKCPVTHSTKFRALKTTTVIFFFFSPYFFFFSHLCRTTPVKILSLFLFPCLLPSLSRRWLPFSTAVTIFFSSLQSRTVALSLAPASLISSRRIRTEPLQFQRVTEQRLVTATASLSPMLLLCSLTQLSLAYISGDNCNIQTMQAASLSQTFIINKTPQLQVARCKHRVDEFIIPTMNFTHLPPSWKLRHAAQPLIEISLNDQRRNMQGQQVCQQYEFYNDKKLGKPIKFNALLTTYEVVLKDKVVLSKIRWSYLMCSLILISQV
ncbi:hypothetical protein Ahy_B05g074571 [Arachis hypogaea]|uniref:Uncharacterized protein n=1 Tax=Arachis hypogaea TaxID=3818 RepID=A0A444YZ90_ARAHY|nr:hypothetical protein Ahy_B05g074571 [Arachis hypogaea]